MTEEKILILSPHTDDAELGCGGSISKFVEEKYPLENQLNKINGIFTQLEAEIDSQQAVSANRDEMCLKNPVNAGLSSERYVPVFDAGFKNSNV